MEDKAECWYTTTVMSYELVVVLDGEATAAKKKSVRVSVEKTLKVFKGKVVDFSDWGVKTLAYKIGKSKTGVFLLYDLELEANAARELGLKLRLNEDIIRYLLIKQEGKKVKE
ncbi:MAG: 30S ribosomal protein S6 [Candidatus Woesebacteria bacterium GW2011_GWB1_43_14]|uniref:Small ribosomal subunit protein bS6 n=1 Tax=Candidatus Woesebacteria bacterium GW2011_GWB1_43_14 TaxID=1618578 RepID=A0A0G1DHB5_9BACT|nr:MAG: Ribosomal protein S6 [Candidatus Woesebacteria bacterium GW2011_GWC1_42_9]KKS96987.1 MAG: 30S ribosomal protein S6 [Candidatus Woesebacteria bacterium GW2011_GWB1_43_14]